VITSPANPAIKRIRALRRRKEREMHGLCVLEGIRLVGEAVQLAVEIDVLVQAPALLQSDFARDLLAVHRQRGGRVLDVSPDVFATLAHKDNPQGLAAVVHQRWDDLQQIGPLCPPGWVALAGVADPGNLGTIIRTADAVGMQGVILLDQTADPYDPGALRASMGAVFSQRLVRTDTAGFASWKAQTGVFVLGTSDRAEYDYRQADYAPPLVLLMGSEREGLSAEQMACCDLLVRIPMRGRSDSLNLAVATGVMLYELSARESAATPPHTSHR
jgi:TrmH family RNA methyltransferase